VFSFYGNKTITTGEGGMVVAADETLFQRAVHLKGQGLAKYREYWHDVVGYNYRMTNICAAIGLAQLEQAEAFIARKRAIAIKYTEMLHGTPYEMHLERPGTTHSYWMMSLLTPHASQRDELRNHLALNGIETRPTFYPVHTMPMYSQRYERHTISENIALRGINLPSHPGLSDAEVKRVVDTIKAFPIDSAESKLTTKKRKPSLMQSHDFIRVPGAIPVASAVDHIAASRERK
jgi:perosamine synthetase